MNKIKISKFLCGLLRHFPEDYNLKYDSNGWFNVDEVVNCIQNNKDENISKSDITHIVNTDSKGRYELDNNRIRTVYGHSIDVNINKNNPTTYPSKLYHGTAKNNINSIMKHGLNPQSRQKVHLTDSITEAKKVGKRHSDDVVLLSINVDKLLKNNYDISNPNDGSVYTISEVPPKYIEIM